jgi:hypothetical protein
MKKAMILISSILIFGFAMVTVAEEAHKGHDMNEMADTSKSQSETFKHDAVVDGVRAEFQVMSLASMNMTDEGGATHHVMAKFIDENGNKQINQTVGKIKVISPTKKEQVKSLDNYNGIFAANFMFMEKGKYGVICLIKVDGQKKLFKFWYPHHG